MPSPFFYALLEIQCMCTENQAHLRRKQVGFEKKTPRLATYASSVGCVWCVCVYAFAPLYANNTKNLFSRIKVRTYIIKAKINIQIMNKKNNICKVLIFSALKKREKKKIK